MPEDPDDIGYIRKSNGSEFAYDNNIPKETMTVDEEIKAPNQVYHLKTSDLQQNAGQELQKNGNTQAQDDNTKAKTTEFWKATVIDTDSVTESMGKAQSEVESLDLDENMFESLKEFPRTNYDEKQDVWQTHL